MVTSIDNIKSQMIKEVSLEGWDGETPFVCKLKRLSVLGLAKSGKIPNELLADATKLFDGAKTKGADAVSLKDMAEIIDIIVENSLVEPSIKELKDADIELTDTQKYQIFSYAQDGIKALKPFPENRTNSKHNSNGKDVA